MWAEVDEYIERSREKKTDGPGDSADAVTTAVPDIVVGAQDGGRGRTEKGAAVKVSWTSVREKVLPAFNDRLLQDMRKAQGRSQSVSTFTRQVQAHATTPMVLNASATADGDEEEEENEDDDGFCMVADGMPAVSAETGPITAQPRAVPISMEPVRTLHSDEYITHIEVLTSRDSTVTVRARGFHRLAFSCNPGAPARNTFIWIKVKKRARVCVCV